MPNIPQRSTVTLSARSFDGLTDSRTPAVISPTTTVAIIHEIGINLAGSSVEEIRILPPSTTWQTVKVVSKVVGGHVARKAQSQEYIASVRRRKAAKISMAISSLKAFADREDIVVYTHPVVNDIKDLLNTLGSATSEGNTREIVRQVRNTMMNGGWIHYRTDRVLRVVSGVFQQLAGLDEVLPKHVEETSEKLRKAGLNLLGGAPIPMHLDESEFDGEDEVPD